MASRVTSWNRFVRYVSQKDGQVRWGEPILKEDDTDLEEFINRGELEVKVLEGDSFLSAKATGEEDVVKQLLGPLVPADVPIIRCVGINYLTHIKEIGFDRPENPTMFFKPSATIADTGEPIPIPKLGQACLDFEGELTVVIGREAKNVSEADALDYVAGYVASNDVSCRDWQMDKDKAGYDQQWCFSKSFDKYAPLGPQIVSRDLLGDADGLALTTKVNGQLKQTSNTNDLCFGVRKLVSFLSTGQTIPAGSLIMTGTPGGVLLGMKPKPVYLQDGDEVVVEIEKIGKVRNVMRFE